MPSASYNPLDELDLNAETFVDDAGLVADALIIDSKQEVHWTDAAKTLILAIILFMFAPSPITNAAMAAAQSLF